MRTKTCFLFLILVAICSIGRPSFGQESTNILSGYTSLLQSEVLGEDRRFIVNLPEGYHDSEEGQYPIIILLDGDAHVKHATASIHFLGASRNRNRLMPESIVVAISNVDRERDFVATKIETARPNSTGGGDKFLEFLSSELIPHIDKQYRTKPHRTLIGHSLGGLLTIHAYLKDDSIFDAYIAIDPSIWWEPSLIESKVAAMNSAAFNRKLFIATANTGEAKKERNKGRHDHIYAMLLQRGVESIQVGKKYYEEETHRSVPLIAIYDGLKYIHAGYVYEDK